MNDARSQNEPALESRPLGDMDKFIDARISFFVRTVSIVCGTEPHARSACKMILREATPTVADGADGLADRVFDRCTDAGAAERASLRE